MGLAENELVALSITASCRSVGDSRLLSVLAMMSDKDSGLDSGFTTLLSDPFLLVLEGRLSFDKTWSGVEGALASTTLSNLISEPAPLEILLKARGGVLILSVKEPNGAA